ncbi:MAG: type IX secretion system sortase PorU [Prevotella sp.]|nr:type IX secretion system sortase PorU [Prevotella sp.]
MYIQHSGSTSSFARVISCVILFLIFHFSFLISPASAQTFFNLTADEVSIDSVVPSFNHSYALGAGFADSIYSVEIEYPEFIDMSAADVARYQRLSDEPLPALPVVESHVAVSRGQGLLRVSLVPLVFREGRYQKLVSFKLAVKAEAVPRSRSVTRATADSSRYAAHSVLATGQWAKISVTETGVYQLTDALVRKAGFSNSKRVKIYGYGGALQPEKLTGDYLAETDDLQEVPTYTTPNGRRLFHAVGPVGWSSPTATTRTRNPYADYGCYFLTESDGEPLTQDSAAFVSSFYPTNNDYHYLYEVDNYAWYHTGSNLYDSRLLSAQKANKYELPAHADSGQLTVVLTSNGECAATVTLNDSLLGTVNFSSLRDHTKATVRSVTYRLDSLLKATNTITLTQTQGEAEMRLDYIGLTLPTPAPLADLQTATLPEPKLVYRITNQDHHADGAADMVIIIPTTQQFVTQAQRLKQLHEQKDSLRVNIVPADELFNEFSSGTPDANAYRRYLKMLYDRAATPEDRPRYLLLFGDGAWDNRMLTSNWRTQSPDDFLLCYESDNSVSETDSYVSDDYYCLMDDGEGGRLTDSDTPDIGAGRLPARNEAQAKVMVDKIISYHANELAGDWQNVVCFLGDDGNGNVHMKEANSAAKVVEQNYPGFNVKRIFWDAYQRVTNSTGNRYPDVERLIKQQMRSGALIIDYCGHGAAYSISHERVLTGSDFATQTSLRLPLWVTASCDIMPYDTHEDNIGETAMLNENGGSIAFYGTTRTVYTGANEDMNCTFMKNVLGYSDGRRNTLGDAVRLTKSTVWSASARYNKLHYTLLGDPALTLAAPTAHIVIDSINGRATGADTISVSAGTVARVKGHIEGKPDFNGTVTLTVKDVEETISGLMNLHVEEDASVTSPYTFQDRPNTLYVGTDSVRAGHFDISFALSRDVAYSDEPGQIVSFAIDNAKTTGAHGTDENFRIDGNASTANDGIGPSIYCYLNSSDFTNGGSVNTTPYFYAELSDKDGISASESGLGHNLELVIDGEMEKTYNLNEAFQYNFGDYRSGSLGYSLPELEEGPHSLRFRAWDVLNNSSLAELTFNVVKGLSPKCLGVTCTKNPATTATTFIVNHDRAGSQVDIILEIFDTGGRKLWEHAESGISTGSTYTLNWNLAIGSGSRLRTGVYLYRVLISTDGGTETSPAQKLIIL